MNTALNAGHAPAVASHTVLLVLSESENVARRIESHLRNAGHPVRAAWVGNLESLESLLSTTPPHLLLCADGMPAAPVTDAIALAARACPDLPVLLLSPRYSVERTLAALAMGARDQVSCENEAHMRHLEAACLRELASHANLRELKATRIHLADYKTHTQQQMAGSSDAVAHVQEGVITDVNPAFAELLGYENPDDLTGLPLMDLVSPDFQQRIKDHLKLLNKGKAEAKPLECGLLKKDGVPASISAEFTRTRIGGETVIEIMVRAPEAGGGVAAESGRILFLETLAATIKNQQGAQKLPRATLFFSIDDYAGLENRLGFHDSEEAVVKLLEWMRGRLSPQDQLFRFSSGELAAIVARPNVADFEQLGDLLIRECTKQIFATRGHEAHLDISIAIYPLAGAEQAAQLVNEIAAAARKLSAQGGRRSLVLGPTAKSSAEEREEARRAAQLKKALEENRLKLICQAIASLEGDPRQHLDVMVRMIDENGRELQATDFMSAAEKFGLTRALDRWVTAHALKLSQERDASAEPASLFVKLSEDTLKDADSFLAWLGENLKSRGNPLSPGEMVFEFKELRLQNHIRKAKTLTRALKDLGASIAIEHYGAGANSVHLLEHIPATYLKFHSSFTAQFGDKDMQKKMASLMEVAKQHEMKTIVCHVEDANVMARLWQMGVNFIQGQLVQEPEQVMMADEKRSR